MIKIKEAVIVEGRYDKIKLSSIIDGIIIETNGFSIFKDKEKLDFIRKLAAKRGILILTDSDAAGFKIRSYIGGSLPKEQVKHAYIPDIFGKEKRKDKPSKEGKLGVEGIKPEAIIKALKLAGVTSEETANRQQRITKTDLFEDGFSGRPDSKAKRLKLLSILELPERLSANVLVDVLNAMLEYDEYKKIVHENFM